MSIPVMEAHSGAFRSIPVRSGPFLLLYAPLQQYTWVTHTATNRALCCLTSQHCPDTLHVAVKASYIFQTLSYKSLSPS